MTIIEDLQTIYMQPSRQRMSKKQTLHGIDHKELCDLFGENHLPINRQRSEQIVRWRGGASLEHKSASLPLGTALPDHVYGGADRSITGYSLSGEMHLVNYTFIFNSTGDRADPISVTARFEGDLDDCVHAVGRYRNALSQFNRSLHDERVAQERREAEERGRSFHNLPADFVGVGY